MEEDIIVGSDLIWGSKVQDIIFESSTNDGDI